MSDSHMTLLTNQVGTISMHELYREKRSETRVFGQDMTIGIGEKMSRPYDIGLTFIKILHLQRLFGIYGISPIQDNIRA